MTNQQLGIPGHPHRGGTLTVLEGAPFAVTWQNLDPGNPTAAAYNGYMDAVFGQLFDLGPKGRLLPDLATGYAYSNGGKTTTIYLRKHVKFSDGTRFDAQAVKWNWERDLKSSCTCKPVFNQAAPPVITTHGRYAISVTLQYVDAAFVIGLQYENFDWIASPTAERKMGPKAFALKPVGAGPFEVVSDTPSNELVLRRNPRYYLKGRPYLNHLVFKSVANDQAGLEAMQAGSGQAYEGMETPSLVPAFKAHFHVTVEPSTSPYGVELNTAKPPFNDLKARQAVYDAIDCPLLDKKLFADTTPCGQSFEAPAGLFYEKKVPGYLTYDPVKARALVKQLGGLSFDLLTVQSPVDLELMEALQTEFQAVGMKVHLDQVDLSILISKFSSGGWQASLEYLGDFDPAAGLGLSFRFNSKSVFSGVHSATLDKLITEAGASTDPHRRRTYYNAAAEYIARNALAPFLFPVNDYDIVVHGSGAPGLSTPLPSVAVNAAVLWQDAYTSK